SGREGALAFGLITLAACLRVAAPLLPALYLPLIAISGLAWISAFAAFIVPCAGALLTRQGKRGHDGKPRSTARYSGCPLRFRLRDWGAAIDSPVHLQKRTSRAALCCVVPTDDHSTGIPRIRGGEP